MIFSFFFGETACQDRTCAGPGLYDAPILTRSLNVRFLRPEPMLVARLGVEVLRVSWPKGDDPSHQVSSAGKLETRSSGAMNNFGAER
jgi:hypothetical protein